MSQQTVELAGLFVGGAALSSLNPACDTFFIPMFVLALELNFKAALINIFAITQQHETLESTVPFRFNPDNSPLLPLFWSYIVVSAKADSRFKAEKPLKVHTTCS